MVKSRLLSKAIVFLLIVSSALSPVTVLGIDMNTTNEYSGPGKHETELYMRNHANEDELVTAGSVVMQNTRDEFIVSIETTADWLMSEVYIFVGTDSVPVSIGGTPQIGQFPYRENLISPTGSYELSLNLRDDLNFAWGNKKKGEQLQNVSVCVKLVSSDLKGKEAMHDEAWAFGEKEFDNRGGWWTTYALSKPHTGHFIDSPVGGAGYATGSQKGKTDSSGAFDYIEGEIVSLHIGKLDLGHALAKDKVTILDLVGTDIINDTRVINMARLLQSMDEDGDPIRGIFISEPIIDCLEMSMDEMNINDLDFSDSDMISSLLDNTADNCSQNNITLTIVSPEEALENLEKGLEGTVFRKNVSKTPEEETAKAKLELMSVYVPAQKANGDPVELIYRDAEGTETSTRTEAKPLVVVYADEIPDTNGAMDVFGAVSRDEGNTWKVTNLSRSADKSSFKLENGYEYPGDVLKPNLKVQGNKILAVWTSQYARSGQPTYSLPSDNDYYEEDIWGVSGPQKSTDYAELDFPEVGELPYHCVWTCRGVIDPLTGEVTWYKPERLTSGRRDAYQIAVNGANNAGFGVVWQEDPEGVRPGEMAGPGEGWSGATTNHKTDIWYSYIKWADFEDIDENFVSGGDPERDDGDIEVIGRPKALVPFSLPVRISDNDTLNSDNMKLLVGENGPVRDETGNLIVTTSSAITTGSAITKIDSGNGKSDKDEESDDTIGSHSYGIAYQDTLCDNFYLKINNQGEEKWVTTTSDGRLLDGDTGASRPNIMMQPYQKDGDFDAYVMICYEETKGVGSGPPDDVTEEDVAALSQDDSTGNDGSGDKKGVDRYYPDKGKNVIYHSFTLTKPDTVSAGTIINPQATDELGNLLYLTDEEGNELLDWNGEPIPAYENARRPRLIIQSKKNALDAVDPGEKATVMVTVFKMGEEGKGRTSDIFMRRWAVVDDTNDSSCKGNPYKPENLAPECQNISSVTPTEYWINPDSESQNKDSVKVVEWEQTVNNISDQSWTNNFDDARAHRGFLKGNFLAIAYDWTPNWAAARNGNDVYNLYIRRSFDGGNTWTTDPNGVGVTHNDTFKSYPDTETVRELPVTYEESSPDNEMSTMSSTDESKENKDKDVVQTYYAQGAFEPARNVSQITNNKETVIEPRLVGVPGTIEGGYDEDVQATNAFWVTYGTHSNPGRNDEEEGVPLDLFYSYSTDFGDNFYTVTKTIKSDSDGNNAGDEVVRWDWLAKDSGQKLSEQAECQIRMTPDGSIFYAVWNETGEDGSDALFRRIMRDGGSIESVDIDTATDVDNESSGNGGTSDSEDASQNHTVITEDISNIKTTEVETEDNKLKITVPASALNGDATLTAKVADEEIELTTGIKIGNLIYSIEVKDKDGNIITEFSKDLVLEFHYDDEDIPDGVNEEDLKICYWDEVANKWIAIPSDINTLENKITAVTNHLTIYGVMAIPEFPKLYDVKGHWAESEVYRLVSLNIASGDVNGKIRPEDKITREEFAKLLVLAAGLKAEAEPNLKFEDSDSISSWAKGYVAAAVNAGFIQGYENNTFKPKQHISRVEIATVVVKALNIQLSEQEQLIFSDVDDIPQWGVPYVAKAVEKGIVTGFSDGTFKSDNNATRAQALVMISRMLNVK